MSMDKEQRPKVGVGVIITHSDKILLGKRKNSHGEGTWCLPGGHLEFNESVEACAQREVLEETGLQVENVKCCTFTNDIFQAEGKHYVTLFVTAEVESGEVRVMEPDKCEEWAWFAWNNLPAPLFLPIQNLLEQGFQI